MKNQIDLHVHTTASDGLHSPAEIVLMAKNLGLRAVGIADHDTVAGLKEALSAGKKHGIEVVPGVEITNYWGKRPRREFHTLGYFFHPRDKHLIDVLTRFQKVRQNRARKIVRNLGSLGYRVTFEEVQKIAGGAIGRPHPARAVINNEKNKKLLFERFGKIPSVSEFIEAYIIEGKPAFVEKAGLEPDETIKLIHRAGGLAVLAHPGWSLKTDEEATVKQLVGWGLDGLEAIHGKRTKKETLKSINRFRSLAVKHRLLITAGSDFHARAAREPGNELGLVSWQIPMPYELLKLMKARLASL